ncbi:hypothetical protein SADUNF_Sadunf02G0030700 [Salix dunnii]|uniref:Uncharacterized protein n=1 Tax=Salix dunnii TaxID=1413687 RepID=A0A835N5X2_9ROSI|nr:hypothetical protein SADUNF_Sadunf02G0030700 [Salix dunnii]
MVAENTVSTHRQGIPGSNKINGIVVALPIDMSSSKMNFCKLLLHSNAECHMREKARESSQTWHPGMILHELKNSSSFLLYLKITVSGESNP